MIHSRRSEILRLPPMLSILWSSKSAEDSLGAELWSIWRELNMEAITNRVAFATSKKTFNSIARFWDRKSLCNDPEPADLKSSFFSLPTCPQQMREFTFTANIINAKSFASFIHQWIGFSSGGSSWNHRQQHGHEQARSSLHLLRKALLTEVWTEDSHPNAHRWDCAITEAWLSDLVLL